MEEARLCRRWGVPLWVVPVLEQAARRKCDKSRRHHAYRLIRRRLWEGGIGLEKTKYPTYVYPKELKNLLRSAFPAGICDYPDPDHSKVVHVTLEDLHLLDHPEAGRAPSFHQQNLLCQQSMNQNRMKGNRESLLITHGCGTVPQQCCTQPSSHSSPPKTVLPTQPVIVESH